MNEKALALQERTHRFFIRVTEFCDRLPRNATTDTIIPQLIASAGSTDSNYRAACRGRSTREFIAKVGVAAEEADESLGWLRSLLARRFGDESECRALVREANELTAIFTKSQKTARTRLDERIRAGRPNRRRPPSIGQSVHRFIGSSVHRFIGSSVNR